MFRRWRHGGNMAEAYRGHVADTSQTHYKGKIRCSHDNSYLLTTLLFIFLSVFVLWNLLWHFTHQKGQEKAVTNKKETVWMWISFWKLKTTLKVTHFYENFSYFWRWYPSFRLLVHVYCPHISFLHSLICSQKVKILRNTSIKFRCVFCIFYSFWTFFSVVCSSRIWWELEVLLTFAVWSVFLIFPLKVCLVLDQWSWVTWQKFSRKSLA